VHACGNRKAECSEMHVVLSSVAYSGIDTVAKDTIFRKRLCYDTCYDTADEGLLVDQAVRKGAEELIGGVVLNQHPFAHCQCLSRGCCHNITFAGIDEHLHSTFTGCRPLLNVCNSTVRW